MKFSMPRIRLRAPSPRIWLGLALVAVSIAGTVWVISDRTQGTGIVLAKRFIPAGTTVTTGDVIEGRADADVVIPALTVEEVIGQRTAHDLADGDVLSRHDIDSTVSSRTVVAVPLGISPAESITSGIRIQLWFVPRDAMSPPRVIAHDVVVISARRGSFGEGDVLDVSISSRDQDALLIALAAEGAVVATTGDGGI